MDELRIALNEEQFKHLVLGGHIVIKDNLWPENISVRIILQDIGIDRMQSAIDDLDIQMHKL